MLLSVAAAILHDRPPPP